MSDYFILNSFALYNDSKIDSVDIAVAISFISIEQAKENFKAQLGTSEGNLREKYSLKSFDMIQKEAMKAWEDILSLVQVNTTVNSNDISKKEEAERSNFDTNDRLNTFYTSLFKAFIFLLSAVIFCAPSRATRISTS